MSTCPICGEAVCKQPEACREEFEANAKQPECPACGFLECCCAPMTAEEIAAEECKF